MKIKSNSKLEICLYKLYYWKISLSNSVITEKNSIARSNSTKNLDIKKELVPKMNLTPNWITGFTDAEGCFSVILTKRSTLKWRVIVSFEINLHSKDILILNSIKDFFGVGSVNTRVDKNLSVYRVTKLDDLVKVIIPHFSQYPLITKKYSDFLLWSKVIELMVTKQHLEPIGFKTVLSYYTSINKGISPKLLLAFPETIGVDKVIVNYPDCLHPEWVSGFVAGDGGFSIGIRPKTGQIYFRFHITQHSRDKLLMQKFVLFFNCGKLNIRSNTERCDYYVQDFQSIYEKIVTHFDNFPLYNVKTLDFKSFKQAAILYKEGGRKNTQAIQQIINTMNSNREF
jgi:hypothetical protein